MRTEDFLSTQEVLEKYRTTLARDHDFQIGLGRYAPILFEGVDAGLNCVFIETQRLLQTRKVKPSDKPGVESSEEILRQAEHLAYVL